MAGERLLKRRVWILSRRRTTTIFSVWLTVFCGIARTVKGGCTDEVSDEESKSEPNMTNTRIYENEKTQDSECLQ